MALSNFSATGIIAWVVEYLSELIAVSTNPSAFLICRLLKDTKGEVGYQVRKPKAASKMLVSELKEELEAQGLPAEGTRPVLYQRVQKARRINKARGRPLWVPPSEDEVEEVCLRQFLSLIMASLLLLLANIMIHSVLILLLYHF